MSILPADIDDRLPPPAPTPVAALLPPNRFTEPVVLVEGYRIPPDGNALADRHPMLRPFVLVAFFLLITRTHQKFARRDHNQLGCKRRVAEYFKISPIRIGVPIGARWRACRRRFIARHTGSRASRTIRNLIDPAYQALHMLMEIAAGIDRCGIKKRKILQAFGKLRRLRHPGRAD